MRFDSSLTNRATLAIGELLAFQSETRGKFQVSTTASTCVKHCSLSGRRPVWPDFALRGGKVGLRDWLSASVQLQFPKQINSHKCLLISR